MVEGVQQGPVLVETLFIKTLPRAALPVTTFRATPFTTLSAAPVTTFRATHFDSAIPISCA